MPRCHARLIERHRNQQFPEIVAVVDGELAVLGPVTKALVHGLQDIFGAGPAGQPPTDMAVRELEQLLRETFPDLTRSVVANSAIA
jgi:hypothetical protein